MKYYVALDKGTRHIDSYDTNEYEKALDMYFDFVERIASGTQAGTYNIYMSNSEEGTFEYDVDITVND